MGAQRYAATQDATATPREIEIRAFRTLNGMLAASGAGTAARAAALHKTHRLWSILLGDLLDARNPLPPALKGQLVSLGLWAQRESMARLSDDRALDALIALHNDMIEGLEAQGRRGAPVAPARFHA